jgi:hypothetical protein
MAFVRSCAAIALTAALLASCALHDVGHDYVLKPGEPKGLAVAAFTFSGSSLGSLTWTVHQVVGPKAPPTGEQQIVVFSSRSEGVDWPPPIGAPVPDTRLAGRLAVIELAPGNYEFTRWNGSSGAYGLSSTKPLAIRFKVEAGKATYIGDVHLFWENPKYGVKVFDRSQRDLDLLRKKVPSLTEDQIVTQLAEVPDNKAPGAK